MKNLDDQRLLTRKRQIDRDRKAQAILRDRHQRLAGIRRVANASGAPTV